MSITPSAWVRSRPPVVVGEPPPGVVTFADLGRPDALVALGAAIGHPKGGREGVAALLRHAVLTGVTVLVRPFAFDGVVPAVGADDLGFTVDDVGGLVSCRVRAAHDTGPGAGPIELGMALAALLRPVASAARTARLGARASDRAVLDRLSAACSRIERSPASSSGWLDAVLAATGFGDPADVRRLRVAPDGGAPIDLTMPRVCCVGRKRPGADACPMCPGFPDDATRVRLSEAWLHSLDDDDFRFTVGRDRTR